LTTVEIKSPPTYVGLLPSIAKDTVKSRIKSTSQILLSLERKIVTLPCFCFNHMKTKDRDTGRNRWKVHMESMSPYRPIDDNQTVSPDPTLRFDIGGKNALDL
jgi:hypothetical protein